MGDQPIGANQGGLPRWRRLKRAGLLTGAALALVALAGCSMGSLDFGPLAQQDQPPALVGQQQPIAGNLPGAAGEVVGTGPVRVALLLPLSGDPGLAAIGTSMADGAKLGMDFVTGNPKLGDNITLVIKDSGATPDAAAQQAQAAIAEGASLILGPLRADQVLSAGAVARAAGIPLIGFSNNSSAASPGVYLLNVLPESEVKRSLTYARAANRQAIAAVFANSPSGQLQQAAFRQQASALGISPRGVYTFSSQAEARGIAQQVARQIAAGQVDALFLPDRATAPGFGALLAADGAPAGKAMIIGSADWDQDPAILAAPSLEGAVYPAVDDAGYNAMTPDYMARFGTRPHPLATVAFTAVVLANAKTLSMATPRYDPALLTLAGGFAGRDGVFRFLANGKSEYSLVVKKVTGGGAIKVDGPQM